jgi:hypothetical protein
LPFKRNLQRYNVEPGGDGYYYAPAAAEEDAAAAAAAAADVAAAANDDSSAPGDTTVDVTGDGGAVLYKSAPVHPYIL